MCTLYTTDAAEAINRIIDFFTPHEQKQVRLSLAASLKGIVCQRLVPKVDGTGRTCVLEIAVGTPRLQEAIADPDKTDLIDSIVADGSYSGMQTFDQHLLRLVLDGTVSIGDAALVSSNSHDVSVTTSVRPESHRSPGVPAAAHRRGGQGLVLAAAGARQARRARRRGAQRWNAQHRAAHPGAR